MSRLFYEGDRNKNLADKTINLTDSANQIDFRYNSLRKEVRR